MADHLVVISFWDQRPTKPLRELLAGMNAHDAGIGYDAVIVVNRCPDRPPLRFDGLEIDVIERKNEGVNIGAWNAGWHQRRGYDGYLFLQDDCRVVSNDWLKAFSEAAVPGVGLVGESMNYHWARPWDELRVGPGTITLPEHLLDGQPANRIDVYLDFMQRNHINPGVDGRHLRSLIWYSRADAMELAGGFPTGRNHGECIASELATSRKRLSMGLNILQVHDTPFRYIKHSDWVYSKHRRRHVHIGSMSITERLRYRLLG